MNSRKKTVVLLLFMMFGTSANVRAVNQCCETVCAGHKQTDNNRCQACLNLLGIDENCNQYCLCELMEEIEKREVCRQEIQDQQADILEKLLLESTALPSPQQPSP